MIVYKTTNLINGKIYVGQKPSMNNSEDFFASNYYGSGRLITEAVREFGEVNFKREILDFADTREELNEKETKWISKYNATSADIGYNLSEKTWPPPPGCGKDNSMYGRCAYDIWVEKYEAEEADRRKLLQLKKRGAYKGKDNPNYGNGDKVRGEKNPMFGKGYLKIWIEKYGEEEAIRRNTELQKKKSKKTKGVPKGPMSEETKAKLRKPKSEKAKAAMRAGWAKKKNKLE